MCFTKNNVFSLLSFKPVGWKTVGITFGLGGIILAGMQYVKREKEIGKSGHP